MGAGQKRSAALARRHRPDAAGRCGESNEEAVQLVHPLLEAEDVVGALEQEVGAEAVAPSHLDGEAADVPDLELAAPDEEPALPAHARGAR
jgi:hypothetical protein